MNLRYLTSPKNGTKKVEASVKKRYQFAQFELDDQGLMRDGAEVPMSKHLINLLRLLLDAEGSVVGYSDLAWHVWKMKDVPHQSLWRAVYLIRQALGDWEGDAILKTYHGKGYWIAVPVKRVIEQDPNPGSGSSANVEAEAALFRTLYEIGGDRKDESLRLASSVLVHLADKSNEKANVLTLRADVEIARLIRGNVRPNEQIPFINQILEEALSADPNLAAAKVTKAWVIGMIEGEPGSGIAMVQESLAVQPRNWLSLSYLIWLQVAAYDLEGASNSIEKGLLINPMERNFVSMKGWLLCARRRYKEAAFYLDEMIAFRPEVDLLWIFRAVAAVKMKNYGQAIKLIDHIVGLYPEDSFVLSSQAWTYASSGYREESLEILTRLTKQGRYILPTLLAGIRIAMGDKVGSDNLLLEARKVRCPWFPVAWCDPRLRGD